MYIVAVMLFPILAHFNAVQMKYYYYAYISVNRIVLVITWYIFFNVDRNYNNNVSIIDLGPSLPSSECMLTSNMDFHNNYNFNSNNNSNYNSP